MPIINTLNSIQKKCPPFKTPSEVIDLIKNYNKQGVGIVPLIGSGMSAASGIPAGQDYHAYLFYCLTRVFGINENNVKIPQWDPSILRWPDYSEVPIYDNLWDAMYRWSEDVIKKYIKKSNDKNYNDILWQAVGAVADWRAMLNLLSRLSIINNKNNRNEIILKHPDHRIIDSFFVNLTKGKKPNSSHMLMAHLSDILRIKIILTTNFDNLIESAYQAFFFRIAVFDVHMDVSLPDADFVRAQRSVIKMHGGRYGLRADFSLDKYPTTDDVEKFVSYLSLYRNKDYTPISENQRNLLVMGIAPITGRTIALISRTMIKLKNLKVFWICHKEEEKEKVIKSFKVILNILYKSREIEKDQIDEYINRNLNISVVSDLSLFWLELYQNIFLSLPPAGVQFPSIWPYPPKSYLNIINKSEYNAKLKELKILINNPLAVTNIIYVYGEYGVNSLASNLFYQQSNKYHCLWIDVNKFINPQDFSYSIILAIVNKIGFMDYIPAYSSKANKKHISVQLRSQFNKILKHSKRKFIIFINNRDFVYDDESQEKVNNLIIKILSNSLKNENVTYILLGFLELKNDNIKIIHVKKSIVNEINIENFEKNNLNKLGLKQSELRDFYRFLLSLTLIRHISYLSLFWSWAFIKAPYSFSIIRDNDEIRFKRTKKFLEILKKLNAIREGEGELIFMPDKIREQIKEKFFKNNEKLIQKYFPKKDLNFYKAECHQGIADWHMKLYRASGDIKAIIDSIYHRLQCFLLATEIITKKDKERFLFTSLNETELSIELSYHTLYSSPNVITLIHSFEEMESIIEECKNKINKEDGCWELLMLDSIKNGLKKVQNNYLDNIDQKINNNSIPEDLDLYQKIGLLKDVIINKNIPENIYEDVKQCIKNRDYKEADKLFEKIFNIIKWNNNSFRIKNSERLRKKARNWVNKSITEIEKKIKNKIKKPKDIREFALRYSQDKLKFIIKVLRRYQMLKLYYAQIFRYNNSLKPDKYIKEYQDSLIFAEKIYVCSTEIMRYIKDNDFLNRENAFLRSNTGIMLSWMGRHHEAYRRYNEAYGYLDYGIRPDSPLEFSIVDLRRGETFLCQLEQNHNNNKSTNKKRKAKKLNPSQKRHLGILYDTIASIDRGEYRMRDTSINTWWHCWMYELQLNTCIEIIKLRTEICNTLGYKEDNKYDLFSHCRECEFCGKRFIINLKNGLEIAGKDILRITRYLYLSKIFFSELRKSQLKISIERLNTLYDINKETKIKRIEELFSENLIKKINTPEVKEYIKAVKANLIKNINSILLLK